MPKRINSEIKEILKLVSSLAGCSIQHNKTPCNTCFHSWGNSVGLSDMMTHLFWLTILGVRGDYTDGEIVKAINSMDEFKHIADHNDEKV